MSGLNSGAKQKLWWENGKSAVKSFENAQMGSAEDIRKMLEMMEANQKEQAAEIQKNHR